MATQPTISEREPKSFEPRTINFPDVIKKQIDQWVYKQIETLSKRLELLHKNKVPQWRKTVAGKPRQENKSFPFPDCSNYVVQTAGECVDELVAWVIELIWASQPLVYFRYPATKDAEKAKKNVDKEKALSQFIDDESFDPDGLNLYHYHNKWFTDAASLGKAWICVAPEERLESVWTGYKSDGGSKKLGAHSFEEKMIRKGPMLVNVRYEDILANPNVEEFEKNDPVFRRCALNVRQLRERAYKGHFIESKVKEIINSPDRYGPNEVRKRENQKEGITDATDTTMAEWDIYEGYFSWWHNGKKFRLICWFHQKSKTMLNCVFNFIPDNKIPILETRLSVDGKGAGEMLKDYQEDASTHKNQLNDAILYGTLGVNTIDMQNRNLDRNFTLNPGIFLPAKKDAFQHYEMANAAMGGLALQNSDNIIAQAKQRFGIDAPVGGAGAGSMGKNKQFGSMGTMAVLQKSNTRGSHRTSGFRHSSARLFSTITDFYGFMEAADDELLLEALRDYVERRSKIPVRAADASMNKEVTKQNEIILNQAYAAFIKQTSSLLQAYQNPQAGDPTYKKWLRGIIIGNVRMFQQILKDFQLSDNPQEYCPDIDLPEQQEQPNAAQQPQAGSAGPIDIKKMAELLQQRGASGGGPGATGGGGTAPGPSGQGGGTVL